MKLMMHMVAGYPTLATSEQIAKTILESGADLLEIQIPFSDPVADGPTIAQANDEALRNGIRVSDVFEMTSRLTQFTQKPIYLMTYFNIVHRFGVKAFCKRAKQMGIHGLIIPDYPYDEEEGNGLIAAAQSNHLSMIPVVTSSTSDKRLQLIVALATDFIYCVARAGVTGQKTVVDQSILDYLKRVRQCTLLPLAVGFGISERAQIDALSGSADIAVIGSALIKVYSNQADDMKLQTVEQFCKSVC